MNEKRRPQLLAKVNKRILKELDTLLGRACLKRDAYLEHVFAHEASKLRDELPAANSREARRFMQRSLRELRPEPVTFVLSQATIDSVNRACKELNVNRDCFINRVLFLLVSETAQVEAITGILLSESMGDFLGNNDRDFLYQEVWDGSLGAISAIVTSDPFRGWRNVIEYERKRKRDSTPLHACVMSPELSTTKFAGAWALNCYLPDVSIPDSPEHERMLQSLYDLFGKPVPPKPANKTKSQKKGKETK